MAVSLLIHGVVTRRYEAEALLLIGKGVNSRPSDTNDLRGIINSLASIAVTDDVVSTAATKVGIDRLLSDGKRTSEAPSEVLRDTYLALPEIKSAISVKGDEKSFLLRIAFRHSDPAVAADFVNALTEILSGQVDAIRPGARGFFEGQRLRLEAEVKRSSDDLARFATSTSTYSVHDQRELLLKRASELASSLASARGAVAEKNGQKQALTDQLRQLRPVAQSPVVSGLVDALGSPPGGSRPPADDKRPASDPPILLVKVYQDGMFALLKVNSELVGLNNLEASLKEELVKINQDLSDLAKKEGEFEQLQRNVAVASASAETFGKRIMEEEINSDLANAKLSSVRIVQAAVQPLRPVYPRLSITLLLGLIGGSVASIATVLLLRMRARRVATVPARSESDRSVSKSLRELLELLGAADDGSRGRMRGAAPSQIDRREMPRGGDARPSRGDQIANRDPGFSEGRAPMSFEPNGFGGTNGWGRRRPV